MRIHLKACCLALAWLLLPFAEALAEAALPWAEGSPAVRQVTRMGGRYRRLAADPQGRLLLGGLGCVHRYDGQSWTRLQVPGDLEVSALVCDTEGVVWLATERELGCLRPQPDGAMVYESLNGLIPEAERDHGHVYDLFLLGREVLFASSHQLIRIHDGRLSVERIPSNRRLFMSQAPGAGTYVHSRMEKGLYVLSEEGAVPELVARSHDLAAHMDTNGIIAVLPHPDGVLLLSSMGRLVLMERKGGLRLLRNALSEYCARNQVERALRLADGSYAVGTMKGGVVLAESTGEIRCVLTEAGGDLPSNHILSLLEPAPGQLWISTLEGLVECKVSPGLSVLDTRAGLSGQVHVVRRFDGTVWIGADGGVHILTPATDGLSRPKTKFLEGSQNFVMDFLPNGNRTLGATVMGMLAFVHSDGLRAKHLLLVDPLFDFNGLRCIVPLSTERFVLTSASGICVLEPAGDRFRVVWARRLPSILQVVRDPSNAARLVVRTAGASIFRVDLGSADAPPELLFDNPEGVRVRHLVTQGDSVYAHTDTGTWVLRPDARGFVRVASSASQRILWSGADEEGTGWVVASMDHLRQLDEPDGGLLLFEADADPAGGWAPRGAPLAQLPPLGQRIAVNCDKAGVLWVSGDRDVLRIDTRRLPVRPVPRTGTLHWASVSFDGRAQPLPLRSADSVFSIPAGVALGLDWCMPLRSHWGKAYYQYRLAGEDAAWSAATPESTLVLQRLSPGRHRLELRCVSEYSEDNAVLALVFEVLAPWYQTWPAIVLWAGLGLLGVGGLLRLNNRRHLVRQHELEALVATRTQALRSANELLQSSTQAKTEFVRNVSHELRNPLAGARMMADLLLRGTQAPSQRQQAEQLRGCLGYLQRLLDSSLDLARLEAGQVPFVLTRTDLGRLLHDTAALFEGLAEGRGLSLTLDVPEVGSVPCLVEATHLQRVLLNYLGNAFKFTTKGGIAVRAFRAASVGALPCWRIEISDTGVGVPADLRELLFRPFMRDTRADAPDGQQGAGLGLSLCARLAGLSGGSVGYRPGEAGGSVFHVDWPLLPASASPEEPGDFEQTLASAQVLLVEEDVSHRELLLQFLEQLGVSVQVCKAPGEAAEALRTSTFTIALLSHHLGGGSAFEVLSRWKLERPAIGASPRLCLLTSQLVDGIRDAALQAGFASAHQRPLSLATLVTLLQPPGKS